MAVRAHFRQTSGTKFSSPSIRVPGNLWFSVGRASLPLASEVESFQNTVASPLSRQSLVLRGSFEPGFGNSSGIDPPVRRNFVFQVCVPAILGSPCWIRRFLRGQIFWFDLGSPPNSSFVSASPCAVQACLFQLLGLAAPGRLVGRNSSVTES